MYTYKSHVNNINFITKKPFQVALTKDKLLSVPSWSNKALFCYVCWMAPTCVCTNNYCSYSECHHVNWSRNSRHDFLERWWLLVHVAYNWNKKRLFVLKVLNSPRQTCSKQFNIDNIFFTSLAHFTISGNIINDCISDHLPNFLIFDKFSSLSNSAKLYKRDYSHLNPQHLLSEFQLLDWHSVFLDQDASNMFSTFYNKISVIINYW